MCVINLLFDRTKLDEENEEKMKILIFFKIIIGGQVLQLFV